MPWFDKFCENATVISVQPEVFMEDIVVIALSVPESLKVKEIYKEKKNKSICHYKEDIQEIGRSLNATKGIPLMQGFLRLYIPERDWRNIDVMWDGIGDWQC